MVDLTGAGKNYKIESKMFKIAKNRRAPQRRCGACVLCAVAARRGDEGAWTTLGVGDIISGNFQNKGAWYPGRIVKVLARKGYYNVKYDDGDRESNVPTARLALVQSAEEDAVMRAPGKDKGAGTKRKAPVARGSNNGQKKQRKKG